MHMANRLTCLSNRIGHVGLFDIHVKQIGKEAKIGDTLDQPLALLQRVRLIGFVTV